MTLTFKTLQEFLEQRIVLLESLHVLPNSNVNKKPVTNSRVHAMSLIQMLVHSVITISSFKSVIYFVQKRLLIVKLLGSKGNMF